MTGHVIEVRLIEDGWAVTPELVCLEPPGAECRLSCRNRCEEIVVCGRGAHQCDADDHSETLHCAICGTPFHALSAEDCHIVTWIENWENCYGGGNRTLRFLVEINWEEDGATWSLPETAARLAEEGER